MFGALLEKSPLMLLPLAALGLFLMVFLGAIINVLVSGAGAYRAIEALPLEDDVGGRDGR
jgi:hypothetical protein